MLNNKKNWVQQIENKWQQSQQYVKVTARIKKTAKVVKAVKAVKAVNNDVENINESEWGSDIVIDLW